MKKATIFIHKSLEGQQLWHSGRAQAYGAKLLRLWVQIPPGAGLFSPSITQCFLNLVPQGGAALLIFINKKMYA